MRYRLLVLFFEVIHFCNDTFHINYCIKSEDIEEATHLLVDEKGHIKLIITLYDCQIVLELVISSLGNIIWLFSTPSIFVYIQWE
jgi:hypothetical protein